MKTCGILGLSHLPSSAKAVMPCNLLLQINGPPESPWGKSEHNHRNYNQVVLLPKTCLTKGSVEVDITGQIPPFLPEEWVQIMWLVLKEFCHKYLHSWGNWIFTVVSIRTSGPYVLGDSMPQPATRHLMFAGIFPSFWGSPMVFTLRFSMAFLFNCRNEEAA